MPNRAVTPEAKRAVVELLLSAWMMKPQLRLGQLIENAVGRDIFYLEDWTLVESLMDFADENYAR